MQTETYFSELVEDVKKEYLVAESARAKGFDPVNKVEIPLAMSLAEKVVGLISTVYPQMGEENSNIISQRILDLEKEYGQLDACVPLKIAEEIAKEKYCKFESVAQAIDAGIRVGFAYVTLGVVSSPIEGFTGIKIGKRHDGKEYLVTNYSGPVRSAGGTGAAFSLVITDYLRELFGFSKYDPDEREVKRYVTEIIDYHERINNLQYFPTEEELIFLANSIPIEISGEPSEDKEVSNYKDLPRIETNFIRGGMCLVLAEGLAQKAAKIARMVKNARSKGFVLSDWNFLDGYIELHKKREKGTKDTTATYIKDLVAGRPVFGHPSRSGSFRFRYGRSRVAGFSATSIHPATMFVSNCFLSNGNQLKIEKPTKGCVVTSCDLIDGPIVKFKNGNVKKISNLDEAKKIYKDIEEIIYIGDILFPLGDVMNRNADLLKPGYVEEWWKLELDKKLEISGEKIVIDEYNLSLLQAVELSKMYSLPLHPSYIFYWTQIKKEEFLDLMRWVGSATWNGKLILPYSHQIRENFKTAKRALELLGVEHEIFLDNVVVDKGEAFLLNLGMAVDSNFDEYSKNLIKASEGKENILDIINSFAKYFIKDKAGDFIGARMGRPEKAKLRKLTGSPNVLFPVGDQGGRFKSLNTAVEEGFVKADFPLYYCEKCSINTIHKLCVVCGSNTIKKYYCSKCAEIKLTEECAQHGPCFSHSNRKIEIGALFKAATQKVCPRNTQIPELIKGIKGTSSESHDFEDMAKGILRAKYSLCVNKDGTIRYDATEIPITHFKPEEIGASIERLIKMGYNEDILGVPLTNPSQIVRLMPHDIILPCCPDTKDEKADDVFFNISKFLDEELEKVYGLPKFYNLQKKEDLIGQLVVCMAPHNCAGVVGRILGFCKLQGLVASPFMHAAMRRDCFDYSSYIPIKENGFWKIRKIGEFVESLNPTRVVDGFGTKEKEVRGIETIGLNKTMQSVKVNNFTKHEKNMMIEIKTKLGKKILVTENHKFLIDGKKKRASELVMGDRIPLTYRIDIKEQDLQEINLFNFLSEPNLVVRGVKKIISSISSSTLENILKKLNISKRDYNQFSARDSYPKELVEQLDSSLKEKVFSLGHISFKRDKVSVPIKIKLSNDLLEVIGLYVSEGYARKVTGRKGLNQVYIANMDQDINCFVQKVIFKHFGLVPTENKSDRRTFSSSILYLFFNKILGAGNLAKDKRVPSVILGLPKKKLASFLRGYFEGDGSAEKKRVKVSCDSVSEGLLYDLEFCLARFGIFAKRYEYKKEPGDVVKEFYIREGRKIPQFKITKLIIGSDFIGSFNQIGFLSERKNKILRGYKKMKPYGREIEKDSLFVHDSIISITPQGLKESYCLNVNTDNHLVGVNSILSFQCDGDEAAVMMLLDVLINFSRKFLPSHRGGTQDAPLVLNAHIRAGEVDDQILDFETCSAYPLSLYELAEQRKHSSEVKIVTVKTLLKEGKDPFVNIGFTHDTTNFNTGIFNSSYKILPTMKEKVEAQMDLDEKLRAVDTSDVARLIIERHLIRDIRGNLRKFSHQQFRCVSCNEKFRRPPLAGVCHKCGGKILFTISEGSIRKYLEHAIMLAENYGIPAYTKQALALLKLYIESIFGKETEKQIDLKKFF